MQKCVTVLHVLHRLLKRISIDNPFQYLLHSRIINNTRSKNINLIDFEWPGSDHQMLNLLCIQVDWTKAHIKAFVLN